MTQTPTTIRRRSPLRRPLVHGWAVTALGFLLVACSLSDPSPGPDSGQPETEPQQLPEVSAYRVAEDEPAIDVKRAAVSFIETTFNYEEAQGTAQAARERLTQAELGDEAITADTPFPQNTDTDTDIAGAAQVIYPQLGGLTDDQASIMAVTEITTLQQESLLSTTLVIDLRLTREGESWNITEIASMGGSPPELPSPESDEAGPDPEASEPATRVLHSPDIELPSSAHWDILENQIDERVLTILLELSQEHTLSVAVLATGHPVNVFDSPSVSNHTHGRAVDIWAIDGVTISDLRESGPEGPAGTLMERALEQGATEVGGPWALGTAHGSTFTNTVHQDHLHIGFKQ